MTGRKFKNDFQVFKEDTTYTITAANLREYYIKNGEDPGEMSPNSFPQKIRFEFGDKVIISTHQTANGETFRYIYEGSFKYSKNSILKKLTFKEGYAVFHVPKKEEEYGYRTELSKSISGKAKRMIEFEKLTYELFAEDKITDEYNIYKGKYENILGDGNKSITEGKHAEYFKNGWHEIAFEEDLITGNSASTKTNNASGHAAEYTIKPPRKFNKKSSTKIKSFDVDSDILKIDTASFGIDDVINPATAAQGKNKKEIRKLASQEFDFLYDQKKGGIYFNENGADKGFGKGGIIAILKGAPNLIADNVKFI